jgi:hypothetical protein
MERSLIEAPRVGARNSPDDDCGGQMLPQWRG